MWTCSDGGLRYDSFSLSRTLLPYRLILPFEDHTFYLDSIFFLYLSDFLKMQKKSVTDETVRARQELEHGPSALMV